MEDIIINIAAVLALVLPVFSVLAAYKLWRLERTHKGIATLRERAQSAGIMAFVSVLGGLLGLQRLYAVSFGGLLIPREIYLVIVVLLVVSTSIPNIWWLYQYRKINGKHRTG